MSYLDGPFATGLYMAVSLNGGTTVAKNDIILTLEVPFNFKKCAVPQYAAIKKRGHYDQAFCLMFGVLRFNQPILSEICIPSLPLKVACRPLNFAIRCLNCPSRICNETPPTFPCNPPILWAPRGTAI